MAFQKYTETGKPIRYKKAVVDCSKDTLLTEQIHKKEVNINNIIKKHGLDLIAKTAALQNPVFDDNPLNDFTEAMNIVAKANETFMKLPSEVRIMHDNKPEKFIDWISNPDNVDEAIKMGLLHKVPKEEPLQVFVTNPASAEQQETPTTSESTA